MNAVSSFSLRNQCSAATLLALAVIVTALAYRPGLGGSFHFDDPHNLDGLTEITDRGSALHFVTSGGAGPLGRPIALATFVPQAYAWPNSPDVFLYTNICIHLLNGILVAWMFYLLGCRSGRKTTQAGWTATIAATIWMLLPILASSSLLVVQRMTTLSATFMLFGFVAYLYGRGAIDRRPKLGLAVMSAGLVLGTALAALTKENGALLPILILVAELTVLRPPADKRTRLLWRPWQCIFLIFPAIALVGYLAFRFVYPEATALQRGFWGDDRLLTQAHILWQYLAHAFLPATSALGPFHDHIPPHTNWFHPVAIVVIVGWASVIVAAVMARRQMPLFTFGVAWYLAGHALESTTIPLELYFEHRNYVPLIGPVFAVTSALVGLGPRWRPVVTAGLASYAVILAIVLFSTTSLWGKPALAAEMWAKYSPASLRATQYLARQFETNGDYATSKRVLRRHMEEFPENSSVALQILGLSCFLEPEKQHQEQIELLEYHLKKSRFRHDVAPSLEKLYEIAREERCVAVTPSIVFHLAATTLENPTFAANTIATHNLHLLLARGGVADRDLEVTMHHIERALAARYALTTVATAIHVLRSAGLDEAVEDFVKEAHARAPRQPIRAIAWAHEVQLLDELAQQGHKHDD
jgi:protein O-mannosyl-transferase